MERSKDIEARMEFWDDLLNGNPSPNSSQPIVYSNNQTIILFVFIAIISFIKLYDCGL